MIHKEIKHFELENNPTSFGKGEKKRNETRRKTESGVINSSGRKWRSGVFHGTTNTAEKETRIRARCNGKRGP